MIIRPLAAGDIPAWKRLRAALWPRLNDDENDVECSRIFEQPSRFAVFVGVGRRLVSAAEEWARARGCTEMGSDSILENVDGQNAHARLGYLEVERQVCFRKSLIEQGGK